MGYSLLCGRNASWIGTFLYSNQSLRQFDLTFFNELAVLDDVDGYIRVDIPQNIKVYVDIPLEEDLRKNFSRIRRQNGYGSFYKLLLTRVERIKNGHTNKKVGGMS